MGRFDIYCYQKEILLIRINNNYPSVSEIVNQNALLLEVTAKMLRNPEQ